MEGFERRGVAKRRDPGFAPALGCGLGRSSLEKPILGLFVGLRPNIPHPRKGEGKALHYAFLRISVIAGLLSPTSTGLPSMVAILRLYSGATRPAETISFAPSSIVMSSMTISER